ncbi:MAG: AI-2E family transporter [Candidatus Aquicultorales bacterium]
MREFPHKKWALVSLNIWFLIGFLALAIWLVQYFFDVVLIVLFAGVIALVLQGTVAWLAERTGLPWWASSAIVFTAFLIAFLGTLFAIGIPLAAEAGVLIQQLPQVKEAIDVIVREISRFFSFFGFSIEEGNVAARLGVALNDLVADLLQGFAGALSAAASAVAAVGTILILSLYFLVQTPSIAVTTMRLVPASWTGRLADLWSELYEIIVTYVKLEILKSTILGAAVALGMYALGLPSPLLLGVIAGVLDLIPIFGPILGAIPAVTFALFDSVSLAILVVLYFVALQQIESYLLSPILFGKVLEINPVLIVISLTVGFKILGVYGALFAVPVLSMLLAVVRHAAGWYFEYAGDTKGIQL